MLGNSIFFFVDLEIDKEVKFVLVVYVMKIFIENYYVFGIYDLISFYFGLFLLEFLFFNGIEYVFLNRRMLIIVFIYVLRLLRYFS